MTGLRRLCNLYITTQRSENSNNKLYLLNRHFENFDSHQSGIKETRPVIDLAITRVRDNI